MAAKETSVEIWKFLDENFKARKDKKSNQTMVHAISKDKDLQFNFVAGGLLYVITEKFPEVKTNILIPTQSIIKAWCKSKINSFF
jgi:hypothetical protein